MTIQEFINLKKQGKSLSEIKAMEVLKKPEPKPKPKTQVDFIINAFENLNISMLEVVLDDKSKYKILLDNMNKINKIYSKEEFISFLNQNFEDLKKKHVKQLKSFTISDDPNYMISIMFHGYFDFELAFNSLDISISDPNEDYYCFMMYVYFDKNKKNITEIFLSDVP